VLSLLCAAFPAAPGAAAAEEGGLLYVPFESVEYGASPAHGFSDKALVSGARLGEGLRGNGLVLDGKDDAALVIDPGGEQPLAAFTLETWVRLHAAPAGPAVVVGKTDTNHARWHYLVGVDKRRALFARVRLGGPRETAMVTLDGPEPLDEHCFHHLALVFNSEERRLQLCVEGRPVDTVWLPPGAWMPNDAGRIWIGWGPTQRKSLAIVGFPGTMDELTLSAADRTPFGIDSIEGAKLDDEEWRRLSVQARLSFDGFRVRAQELLKKNVLDAPTFLTWRLSDRERWIALREVGQMEGALEHCERMLSSLEKAPQEARQTPPHPSPEENVSILPENTVRGDNGRFTFRVRRAGSDRVDVAVKGAAGPVTVLCAHERSRFLPVQGWRAKGEGTWFSAKISLPSKRGKWKLCVLRDPGITALAVGTQEVFRTAPEKARAGADVSIYDLEGAVEWGDQQVSFELAGTQAGGAGPLAMFVVNSKEVSFARAQGREPAARALVGGNRVTVLAVDDPGGQDRAFVEVFGELTPSALSPIQGERVRLGCATSANTLMNAGELKDMLAGVRAIGGSLLSVPLTALAQAAERRGGVTLVRAVGLSRQAQVTLSLKVTIDEVDAFLETLGQAPSTGRDLRIELVGGDREALAAAKARLGEAGVPQERVFAPQSDQGFSDGSGVLRNVGRRIGESRSKDERPAPFAGCELLADNLGAREAARLWGWAPRQASAQTGGAGCAHPEAVILETLLCADHLGLEEIVFDIANHGFRPVAPGGPGVLSRYADRAAVLAGCLVSSQTHESPTPGSGGQELSFQAGGVQLSAGACDAAPAPAGPEWWRRDIRRADDPLIIAASQLDQARSTGRALAWHSGVLVVRRKLPDVQHVYAVNVFGVRAYDCAFANLAQHGIVILSPGDPAIAWFELAGRE